MADSRRWLRDMGALLALPAMWVDHEPNEIATGLLSVLFGVLQLDGAYARFDDPHDGGRPLETWRPSGPRMPAELQLVLECRPGAGAGRHDHRGRRPGARHVPGHEPPARAAVGDRPGARVRRSERLPDGDRDAPAARRGQPGGDRDPHRTSPRARARGALGRRGRAASAERAPAIARRRRRAVARVDRRSDPGCVAPHRRGRRDGSAPQPAADRPVPRRSSRVERMPRTSAHRRSR